MSYGSRWGGSPPEDSYSVETNLERFAPLHTVADALSATSATPTMSARVASCHRIRRGMTASPAPARGTAKAAPATAQSIPAVRLRRDRRGGPWSRADRPAGPAQEAGSPT
ncbi:DUF6226 family protein [Microbacterium sp. S308A+]|uniref:DUF6226 family protein n=1 Tax=Microbacterium sp. S308A+ TaxID=3415135 RepID=UPI003C7AF856